VALVFSLSAASNDAQPIWPAFSRQEAGDGRLQRPSSEWNLISSHLPEQPLKSTLLTSYSASNLRVAVPVAHDADLERLVAEWPNYPAYKKAVILAIANAPIT
jgi:hypothetical protein